MVTKHLENEATTRAHNRAEQYANEKATAAGNEARAAVMAAYTGPDFGEQYWDAQHRAEVAYDRAWELARGPAWDEEYTRAQPQEWRAVWAEYEASGALDDDVVR